MERFDFRSHGERTGYVLDEVLDMEYPLPTGQRQNRWITHADGTTSTKKWQMVPWIPAGQKFTAKKNFASSMQSHKIGSVNAYNDLYPGSRVEERGDGNGAIRGCPRGGVPDAFRVFRESVNEEDARCTRSGDCTRSGLTRGTSTRSVSTRICSRT